MIGARLSNPGLVVMNQRIVLATGNAGKAKEFAEMLGGQFDIVLQTTLQLANSGCVAPADVCLAHDMMIGTEVFVVSDERESLPARLSVGMAEGRRLSPAFFSALAAHFRGDGCDDQLAVGLNPPEEAALRFSLHVMDLIPCAQRL